MWICYTYFSHSSFLSIKTYKKKVNLAVYFKLITLCVWIGNSNKMMFIHVVPFLIIVQVRYNNYRLPCCFFPFVLHVFDFWYFQEPSFSNDNELTASTLSLDVTPMSGKKATRSTVRVVAKFKHEVNESHHTVHTFLCIAKYMYLWSVNQMFITPLLWPSLIRNYSYITKYKH